MAQLNKIKIALANAEDDRNALDRENEDLHNQLNKNKVQLVNLEEDCSQLERENQSLQD